MNDKVNFNFESLISNSIPDLIPPKEHPKPKYDFGVAYPDPESIPVSGLINSLSLGLEEEGKDLAYYPHPDGYTPLREFVSKKLSTERNISIEPDQLILTDGALESIYMVSEVLLDPNDVVLTEKYTYSGTLRIFKRFSADVIGIECDEYGMIPLDLEKTISDLKSVGKKIKLLYTIPTFQNPLGFCVSKTRRIELLSITQKYQIPILEDDCYVELNYKKTNHPSIYSLDSSNSIIYVGSFSKIIGPGIRMGYIVAPDAILDKLRIVKSGGGVNQFAAIAIHRYATSTLHKDIVIRNDILKVKRDAMLQALTKYFNFDDKAKWSIPEGGLYIWLELNPKYDLVKLLPIAKQHSLSYQPGIMFDPDSKSGKNCARLCFGYNQAKQIDSGIKLLSELVIKNHDL